MASHIILKRAAAVHEIQSESFSKILFSFLRNPCTSTPTPFHTMSPTKLQDRIKPDSIVKNHYDGGQQQQHSPRFIVGYWSIRGLAAPIRSKSFCLATWINLNKSTPCLSTNPVSIRCTSSALERCSSRPLGRNVRLQGRRRRTHSIRRQ